MKTKKRIIFKPTWIYLCLPHYSVIGSELGEYYKIFMDSGDPLYEHTNSKILADEKTGKEISEVFNRLIKVSFPRKSISSYGTIIKSILKFIDIYSHSIYSEFLNYWKYKRLLYSYFDTINPACFIASSDIAVSDQICARWCQKNHVPFIVIQTAPRSNVSQYVKFNLKNKLLYIFWNKLLKVPLYTHQAFVGEEVPNSINFLWSKFWQINRNEKRNYFVGNLVFDDFLQRFEAKKGIKKNIIICTELLEDIVGKDGFQKTNEIYLAAIKANPKIMFQIKVHPRESIEKYDHIFSKDRLPNVKIVKDIDIKQLYEQCDALIAVFSNTLFEAIACGLQIITVNPENKLHVPTYFWKGIAINVTTSEEMIKGIDRIYTNEAIDEYLKIREKYFKNMFFSTDGKSSIRIAQLIKKLIQN